MAEVVEALKPTHVSAVIDRSGSMTNMWSDTVGGFAAFLEEQKKLKGQAKYSLRVFDNVVESVYENVDEDEAVTVPDNVLPRGSTSLLDAVGKHINSVKTYVTDHPEYEQVVIAIMTDGFENSSKEYKRHDIQALVKEAETAGWQFIFMGANVDAFSEASALGIRLGTNVQYDATSVGRTFEAAATSSNLYRETGSNTTANINFTNDGSIDNTEDDEASKTL